MASVQPTRRVLQAFGASEPPIPLGGGQGTSWRSGAIVLKPLELLESEVVWQADLFDSLAADGFRVARAVRAADGAVVVDGWTAWEAVEGTHEERRWTEVIAVGERFHAALAGTPRPSFLDERTDRWAIGDRVAWGELPADEFSATKHLPRLVSCCGRWRLRASSSTAI